jgi:hypothetical protein
MTMARSTGTCRGCSWLFLRTTAARILVSNIIFSRHERLHILTRLAIEDTGFVPGYIKVGFLFVHQFIAIDAI